MKSTKFISGIKNTIQILTLFGFSFAASAQSINPIVDHHLHLRSQAAAEVLQQINQLQSQTAFVEESSIEATQALAALDLAGIYRGVAISDADLFSMPDLNPSGEYSLVQAENNYIAEQVALSAGRLVGVCSVNPLSDYALDEVQRCAQQLGLVAVKLHFSNSNVNLRSSSHITTLTAFFEFLNVLEYPVLLHLRTRETHYGAVDVKLFIDNVLSLAPNIDIQIAQFAGSGGYDYATDRALGEFILAFESGRLDPNKIQFDLAGVFSESLLTTGSDENFDAYARLRERIRQLDSQQTLFASDWPASSSAYATIMQSILSQIENQLALDPSEVSRIYRAEGRMLQARFFAPIDTEEFIND